MIVETWMTPQPVTVSPGSTIREVAAVMTSRQLRRLPVVDVDQLVGIVTRGDLRRGQRCDPFALTAADDDAANAAVRGVMSSQQTTVQPTTPLEHAAALMLDRRIGSLPVVRETGALVGILTDSDAMRALLKSVMVIGPAARVTFDGTDSDAVIRFVVEHAGRFGLHVLGLLVATVGESREVVATLGGSRGEPFVDAAWAAGLRVRNVIHAPRARAGRPTRM